MPILLTERRGFLLGIAALFVTSKAVAATKIQLRGKLFSVDEDIYSIDPEGESESVTLSVNHEGYLAAYLKGSEGRSVTITVEPQ
jgi:hypothetical protein